MIKTKWLIIIILVGSFTGCHGERILSSILFSYYCGDESRVGQFIYERVGLGGEYFLLIPNDKSKVNYHFLVDDSTMLDKALLEQDYIFSEYMELVPLSIIGPIHSIETSVFRRSDDKLLGKSVSLHNGKGWFAEMDVLGQSRGDSCPKGYDKRRGVDEVSSMHATLSSNIFYKR